MILLEELESRIVCGDGAMSFEEMAGLFCKRGPGDGNGRRPLNRRLLRNDTGAHRCGGKSAGKDFWRLKLSRGRQCACSVDSESFRELTESRRTNEGMF
jgi:hypothetical protein